MGPEARQCIKSLASYRFPKPTSAHAKSLLSKWPNSKRAAVLVGLFVNRSGELRALLSRRAETMRSYAGDTALPGGKVDVGDRNIEDTARREAFEEVGLTLDKHKVPLLCILEPFLAGNLTLVTPVVVFILDTKVRPILNEPEVHSLFSHPLDSFLDVNPPEKVKRGWGRGQVGAQSEKESSTTRSSGHNSTPPLDPPLASSSTPPPSSSSSSPTFSSPSPPTPSTVRVTWGSSGPGRSTHIDPYQYHTHIDIPWPGDKARHIRMHSFLTGREHVGVKPIFGLTASILIRVASIGFRREPRFELEAPDQPSMWERVEHALEFDPRVVKAREEESAERDMARPGGRL